MNELQSKLFTDLMTLVNSDESFFFSDQVLQSNTYRIFNYRLASYSQWLLPGAIESRGITFHVDGDTPLALVSWPFEKFFNLHENPLTMDLDLSNPMEIVDKMDGSLISSMFVNGELWLKSKGSLFSEQATAANKLIKTPEMEGLRTFVTDLAFMKDCTVCMEYTAPDNRIVVAYPKAHLTVLAVRDNQTGEYIPLDDLYDPLFGEFFVADITDTVNNVDEFTRTMEDMQGVEGYIIRLATGQRVKIKTEWYRKLHHIKDSINSQRRLFEAVVYDTVDDVRAAFYDDPAAIALIDEMQEKVSSIYNHMVEVVEQFHKRNEHMERKDYAVKGQKELDKVHFGLAMSKYIGREINYRETMIKHRKDYGIKDDPESSVA